MKRRLFFIIFLLTTQTTHSRSAETQTHHGFKDLKFSKVVLYNFNLDAKGERADFETIIRGGRLNRSAVLPGKELSMEQASRLLGILNDPKTYGGPWASCFIPRHGLVFYDSSGLPLAHIDICFECNRLISSMPIPASGYHWDGAQEHYYRHGEEIKNLEKESKLPQPGFSLRSGRKKLIELCNELKMPYCGPLEWN